MARQISDDALFLYAIHDALRRDLDRLARAVERQDMYDPERRAAFAAGWTLFSYQLHHHHEGEDVRVWPVVRTRLAERSADQSEGLALLQAMEDEHSRVDPALAEIDAAIADGESGAPRLAEVTANLRTELVDHLSHEEADAVPLIEAVLTSQDLKVVERSQRRAVGLRNAGEFFGWILDDAQPDVGLRVLSSLPPPLRLLTTRRWLPAYDRRGLWA